jgi:hypothetical protein
MSAWRRCESVGDLDAVLAGELGLSHQSIDFVDRSVILDRANKGRDSDARGLRSIETRDLGVNLMLKQ